MPAHSRRNRIIRAAHRIRTGALAIAPKVVISPKDLAEVSDGLDLLTIHPAAGPLDAGVWTQRQNKADRPSKDDFVVRKFRRDANLRPFEVVPIPTCTRPESYNIDLKLAPFTPSRYTWSGEQRKGAVRHITDSTDRVGHARRETGLEFTLETPPLPGKSRHRPTPFGRLKQKGRWRPGPPKRTA